MKYERQKDRDRFDTLERRLLSASKDLLACVLLVSDQNLNDDDVAWLIGVSRRQLQRYDAYGRLKDLLAAERRDRKPRRWHKDEVSDI
jgi:hypothetical protein